MGTVKDMTGYQFNGCEVLRKNGTSKDNRAKWMCKCRCGKRFEAIGKSIRNGHTKSCGCYRKEITHNRGKNNKTHGDTKTRLYNIYRGMKERCLNKNYESYHRYGGRGIEICDGWKNDFVAFKKWALDNGYTENLTIDRINNDGNYEPNNCRWVDRKTQTRNRSITKRTMFRGELVTLGEISEITGLSYYMVHYRYKNGVDFDGSKRYIK